MKSEAQQFIDKAIRIPRGYVEYDGFDGKERYLIQRPGSSCAECRFCRLGHEGTVSFGVHHWNNCAGFVAYVRARGTLGLDHETSLRVAATAMMDFVPRDQVARARREEREACRGVVGKHASRSAVARTILDEMPERL